MIHLNANGKIFLDKTDDLKIVKTRKKSYDNTESCLVCNKNIPVGSYVIKWGWSNCYVVCIDCFLKKTYPTLLKGVEKLKEHYTKTKTLIEKDKEKILTNNTLREL